MWKCWSFEGTRQRRIQYIQNALISAKNQQKEEFDLDNAVSNFWNIITKKTWHNKAYSFRYNIICKQCELNTGGSWEYKKFNKKQTNKEIFELDEVVKISRFLIINSKKIFAGALNLIIAKKSMKRNWKIKWKNIYKNKTITKYRSLQTKERLQN